MSSRLLKLSFLLTGLPLALAIDGMGQSYLPTEKELQSIMFVIMPGQSEFHGVKVLRDILKYDTSDLRRPAWRKSGRFVCDLVSEDECRYLSEQVLTESRKHWNKKELVSMGWMPSDRSGLYWQFSLPIVCSDRKLAVIKYAMRSESGGNGGILVFKLTDDKWIKEEQLVDWVVAY